MDYRLLGATGVHVSEFTLGAMSFGAIGNTDHDDCVRIIHRALDAGINCLDTADVYSQGESEEICGKALGGRRDDVVLSSKCFWPMGTDRNRRGLSRRWIVRACEESLRRLRTDHIDIYHLHKPDIGTDLDETLGAMDDLVHAGKVRAVATSTFPADLLVEAQWVARDRRLVAPRVEQPPYSFFARGIERDVLPACARYGVGVLVWGPLNSGWLAGRYRGGEVPAGSRGERWASRSGRGWAGDRAPVQRKVELVEALAGLAADAGLSLVQLALAFSVEHPAVTSAIIGPRTMAQLDDQLTAVGVRLDPALLDALDALVAPGTNVDHEADAGWVPPWIADASQRRRG